MLKDSRIGPTLPASDIARAKTWYEEKLGLTPESEDPGGMYYVAGGVRFSVYPSQFAGTAQNTAAEFEVENLEKEVDDLTSRGVVFEQYDFPGMKTNEKGIAAMEEGGYAAAWFKDSEGNIIAIGSGTSTA
jgi:catechol 2,3-dioxygenase-like lactoylglutathione lyase family enzyme